MPKKSKRITERLVGDMTVKEKNVWTDRNYLINKIITEWAANAFIRLSNATIR